MVSNINVNSARRGATKSVSSREPVQLEIAGKIVEHCLYVASLQYWMLLGTEFVPNFMVKLPCGNG